MKNHTFGIRLAFAWGVFMLLFGLSDVLNAQNRLPIDEKLYQNLPFEMPRVEQPVFPPYTVNIRDFGAKDGGVFLNTQAINNAIKDVNAKGGGTVVIPEGLWLSGPIVLLSHVNLHAQDQALVIFSDDFSLYPIIETCFEGLDTKRCQSPISARGAENIAVTGSGVFDGSGGSWRAVTREKMTPRQWEELVASGGIVDEETGWWYPNESSYKGAKATTLFNVPQGMRTDADWESVRTWLRPVMVSISHCKKVLLEGVTFKNSPCWMLHPFACEHITIDNVKVSNPWYALNGDALDLESCKNALVINNQFDAGDDGICIKSGKDEQGRRRGLPCQNVIIRNNIVLHGHGGFVVGSEMSGGVRNIFLSDCTFLGTDVGFRFKSTRGRGGVVENIYLQDTYMVDIQSEPILFDLFYRGIDPNDANEQTTRDEFALAPPVSEQTPAFRNIHLKNIFCKRSGRAIFFNGLPEMPIRNVTLQNIILSEVKSGAFINQTDGLKLENVTIIPSKGPAFRIQNSREVHINGQSIKKVGDAQKIIE